MSRVYNKLVRDKIPDIIKSKGEDCRFEVLNDEDYKDFLDKKLNEEVAEYQSSKSLVELADIIEVIYAIAKTRGFTPEQIEELRVLKEKSKGSFSKGILLIES